MWSAIHRRRAHQQARVYGEALAGGASVDEALRAVVDALIEETLGTI